MNRDKPKTWTNLCITTSCQIKQAVITVYVHLSVRRERNSTRQYLNKVDQRNQTVGNAHLQIIFYLVFLESGEMEHNQRPFIKYLN